MSKVIFCILRKTVKMQKGGCHLCVSAALIDVDGLKEGFLLKVLKNVLNIFLEDDIVNRSK